jgi:hypothetical protein
VLEPGASAPGKVVGQCAQGRRTIVYQRGDAAPPPAGGAPVATTPAPRPAAPVITECKDGSAPVDGRCPKK